MGKLVLTSYVSHGAPTSLVERTRIHDIYEKLGKVLTERGVNTIVISSPHYFSNGRFEVESREEIPCMQDYYGFPEELYRYSYEARNDINLMNQIVDAARTKGLDVLKSQSWGLDHGAWLPLYFMFPRRNVRVVPISINSTDPAEHFKFGEAIRSAVDKTDGMFAFLATGSPVHRLDLVRYGYYGEEKFEPGERFGDKLIEAVESGSPERIMGLRAEFSSLFRAAAPEGNLNPLFIALGASDRDEFVGRTLLNEFMYYGISLVVMILSAEAGLRGLLLGQDAAGTQG